MNHQIKWQPQCRNKMIQRGKRILEANWRGLIDDACLTVWFKRTLPKYASYTMSWKPATDVAKMEDKFWRAVSKDITERYT